MGMAEGSGIARPRAGSTPTKRWRTLLSGRAFVRIALSAASAAVLFTLIAAQQRLTVIWVLWACGILAALSGVDRRTAARITPRLVDAAAPVAGRVGLVLLLIVPFIRNESGNDVITVGAVAVAALLLARALVCAGVVEARRHGRLHQRVLIVGSGEIAARIARTMLAHPEYGMRPIGLVDDEPGVAAAVVPLLGSLASLDAIALREEVTSIVVAFSATRDELTVRLLRACERLSLEMYVVPRFLELGFEASTPDELWGIPLVLLPRPLCRRSARTMKRGFDIVVSFIALLLLSPVMALLFLAIRLSGSGPVTFQQSRVGLDGRHFTLLKFRTMSPNDDSDTTWSVVGDPRIGKLGGFLRRTGLDEAPQLLNVLRGDMSLVGPRPERPAFAEIFAASFSEYVARHRVRAGITGWAQVHGLRGDTSIADRVRFDNYYVATWTLSGDVRILLRTVALVLRQVVPRRGRVTTPRRQQPASAAASASPSAAMIEQLTPPLGAAGHVAGATVPPIPSP